MSGERTYEGIYNDKYGGLTAQGNIVRDAWILGLLAEAETCEGWTLGQMQILYDKVSTEWEKYGYLVNNLPPEMRERHTRINAEAVERAKQNGWDPELGDDD